MTPATTTHRSPRARLRPGARLVFVAMILAILAAACGSSDEVSTSTTTSTKPTTTVATGCQGQDWQTIEANEFTFHLPPGLVDQEVQGIDSDVGAYEGEGLAVSYDYGWFSSGFDELVELGATETAITVDGLEARLLTADLGPDSGYDANHITALHVVVRQDEADQTVALALWSTYDDASLAPVADCIARSVEFTSV